MREHFLPFSRPAITDAEINEVTDSLRSGWITTGPKTKKFEEMLKEYTGAPHAICLSSATAGLHLSLLALDLQPGEEVITTPMTFVATLNMIELSGGNVRLVDAERGTYNMDVNQLEAAINKKTRAIIPVHFTGAPVDLDPVYALAQKYNLRVIEDAAQAIGAEYKGKKLGSFGDIQVFSFHPNKNMTTGEGGCLTTSDDALARRIAVLKFHGIDREAWNRFGKSGTQHYEVLEPGFKYNMMDIQAAIGLHQLPRLDEFNAKRTELAERYQAAFKSWQSVICPREAAFIHKHTWHLYAPTINTEVCGVSRDEFMEKMKERNIGTGLHYRAAHLYPYYAKKYGFKRGNFPNAEAIGEQIVSLPLCPLLTFAEQDDVIEAMDQILN